MCPTFSQSQGRVEAQELFSSSVINYIANYLLSVVVSGIYLALLKFLL